MNLNFSIKITRLTKMYFLFELFLPYKFLISFLFLLVNFLSDDTISSQMPYIFMTRVKPTATKFSITHILGGNISSNF